MSSTVAVAQAQDHRQVAGRVAGRGHERGRCRRRTGRTSGRRSRTSPRPATRSRRVRQSKAWSNWRAPVALQCGRSSRPPPTRRSTPRRSTRGTRRCRSRGRSGGGSSPPPSPRRAGCRAPAAEPDTACSGSMRTSLITTPGQPPERLVRRDGDRRVEARVHEHRAGPGMLHEERDDRDLDPAVARAPRSRARAAPRAGPPRGASTARATMKRPHRSGRSRTVASSRPPGSGREAGRGSAAVAIAAHHIRRFAEAPGSVSPGSA